MKVCFGVVVSRQQVETRDPTRKSSKGLAKHWVTLFNNTRNGFRDEMVKEPIANRAVRLRALGRMFEEAEGDLYANRRTKTDSEPRTPAVRVVRVDVDFVLSPSAHSGDGSNCPPSSASGAI